MAISINLSTGKVMLAPEEPKCTREYKGKSIIALPNDYVLLDLETTGLDPRYDDIIEFAALRVKGNEITDRYQTFVRPVNPIPDFITELTGITNDMVADAPSVGGALPGIMDFIGDDLVIAHNAHFDVNFLYDAAENFGSNHFSNSFIDTLRIARKLLPEQRHHRLSDLLAPLGVTAGDEHRALADCLTLFDCYNAMRVMALTKYGSEDGFVNAFVYKYAGDHLEDLKSDKTEFDETHPLFGKVCAFTGTLEGMTRAEAAQIVVDFGGKCGSGVTQETNLLILGNNDYCKAIKGGKSSKQKKAEAYKLKGYDIDIIPESVFRDMINI